MKLLKRKRARSYFEKTVVNKEIPDDAPEFVYKPGESIRLLDIVNDTDFTSSNAETKRLIKQGGISIDDQKITDINYELSFSENEIKTLKVGKRKFAVLKTN